VAQAAPPTCTTSTITISSPDADMSGRSFDIYQLATIADTAGTGTNVIYDLVTSSDPAIAAAVSAGFTAIGATDWDDIVPPADDWTDPSGVNSAIRQFATAVTAAIGPATATTVGPATGSPFTFTVSAPGVYLILDQGAAGSTLNSIPMIVTTVQNAAGTVCEAEVNLKAETPTITKVANKISANVNEIVTYHAEATIPSVAGYSSYTYKIQDTFSEGLTFNHVYTVNYVKAGDPIDAAHLITVPSSAYTFTYTADPAKTAADKYTVVPTGDVLVWDFSDLVGSIFEADDTIVITYEALVNEYAVLGTEGNPNAIHVEYSNDPSNPTNTETTPDEKDIVYLGQLTLLKVDVDDVSTVFSGVEFCLKGTDTDNTTRIDGSPFDTAPGYTQEAPVANKVDVCLTTDANGYIVFKDLRAGTYTLTEINAPDGYFKLAAPVYLTLTIQENGEYAWWIDKNGNQDKYFPAIPGVAVPPDGQTIPGVSGADQFHSDESGHAVLPVANGAGITNLPFTGGQGIAAAVIAAGLLGGAAFFVARRGRKLAAK
jgi:fimbrial isopeptide formation D2 family protein